MSASEHDRLRARLRAMRVYVLVTAKLCRGSPIDAAARAIEGGADVIQMREKGLSDRELLALAGEYRRLCTSTGTLFVVNDRPDVARLCNADGVHLGQDDLSAPDARKVLLPHQFIGVSTHCMDQARAAARDAADYLGVGPVYPTETKGYTEGVGTEYVAAVARELELPFVALGGITPARAVEVARAGAPAVAVCSAVIAANDVAAAARAIRAAVEEGRAEPARE